MYSVNYNYTLFLQGPLTRGTCEIAGKNREEIYRKSQFNVNYQFSVIARAPPALQSYRKLNQKCTASTQKCA